MARVSRFSASAFALALMTLSTPVNAEGSICEQCGVDNDGGGSIRDTRNDRADNQRDPVVNEPTDVEGLVYALPPLLQLPNSNAPVTRHSDGQIRSSWAVGVFR